MFGVPSSDAAWKTLGRRDPYFGVITHDRFRQARLDADGKADFFRSGEEHVAFVLRAVREQLGPNFRPRRGLDFGCGVGRVAIPLARVCPQVVGVDVSEAMLDLARQNAHEQSLPDIEFVLSDDRLSRVRGTFDLVHSHIVLQHIPARRGLRLIRRLVDLLADGGAGVLHCVYARRASGVRKVVNWMRKTLPLVNNLVNVVQGRPLGEVMMQMNAYNLNAVCATLQEAGCPGAGLHFTDHGGHWGVIFVFIKPGRP
jgi:SAM-dependent methyltransferase